MNNQITRRNTLTAVGAAGVVALAGCVGGDDDNGGDDTGTVTTEDTDPLVRVGTLQDITGENGPEFAHQGLAGFLSGLAYKNGGDQPEPIPETQNLATSIGDQFTYTVSDVGDVGDVEFEVHVRDTESDARVAHSVADELVEEEGVDVLYGLSSSDGLERVNNIFLGERTVPLFVGQASTTNVTRDGDRCREHLFRATANTAMNSRAGAIYIVEETDIENVAMINVPTSFGQDVVENYREIFEEADIDIVLEQEIPVALSDMDTWHQHLTEAEDRGAEAMVYGFTGITGEFFAQAFVDGNYQMEAYGQGGSRMTFREVGQAILDFLAGAGIDEITPEIVDFLPFGPLTCRYFWNQYDNEINDWLVDNHTEVYGVYPDLFTSSAFTSASAIVQAFEQAGEVSRDAILTEVSGMSVEATPKGEGQYEFQAYNNQARSPITVAEYQPTQEENTQFWPASLQPSPVVRTIAKDQTTIQQENPTMTCDLS